MAPRVHQQALGLHEKVLREWDTSGQYGVCPSYLFPSPVDLVRLSGEFFLGAVGFAKCVY